MTISERVRVLAHLVSLRPENRYQSRHQIIGSIAKRFGTRVYDAYNNWFESRDWQELWKGTEWTADHLDARKFVLFNLLKLIKGVEGDTAECGSYVGCSSYAICSATLGEGRHHHIFDSFEGLSAPTDEDRTDSPDILKWKKHDLSIPEWRVRQTLAKFPDVHLYKGWIPERFSEVADRQFAFAHIDVDLYQPTLDSIRFFYPRLATGGLIVCDDYGFSACPGAFNAMNEYAAEVGAAVVHLPTGQGMIMKQPARSADGARGNHASSNERLRHEETIAAAG
jgi:O-methyltransferase